MTTMNPEFSVNLDGSYHMNPATGQIMDFDTGEVFNSPDELEAFAAPQMSGGPEGPKSSTSPYAAGSAAIPAAYLASELASDVAPAAAPAAAAATAPVMSAGVPAAPQLLSASMVPSGPVAPGMLATSGPYAAAALAAMGSGMGLYDASKTWGKGHGAQQDALIQGGNALMNPALGFAGRLPKGFKPSSDVQTGLGLLNPLTAPLSIAKLAGINFFSGKDKSHQMRDAYRQRMKDAGLLPDDNKIVLSDGSSFDIGIDGSHRLKNIGANIDGKNDRGYYDVDFSDPRSARDASVLKVLGALTSGKPGKGADQATGMLVNAVQSSGDNTQNILKLFQDAGLDHDSAYGAMHLLAKSQGGDFDDSEIDAVKNALDELYQVGHYSGGKKPMGTMGTNVKPTGNVPAVQVSQVIKPKDNNVKPGPTMIPKLPRPNPNAKPATMKPKDTNVKPSSNVKPRGFLMPVRGQKESALIPRYR